MSHQIDMSNNRANMAYVNEKPWHGLGQELTQGASIDVWKQEAGMDWSIVETPVRFIDTDGLLHQTNDKKVLYRGDTKLPLSVVGDDYRVVQPSEILEFFRDLVNDAGMFLETAGCLFGGRTFWAMANTKKVDYVGMPDDIVKGHLLLTSGCTGMISTSSFFNATRVVCNNTLKIANTESTANRVRVTHRSVFDADMVKRKLGLYDEAWANYIETANKLAKQNVSDTAAKVIIDSLILTNVEDPAKASMHSKNQADFIMNLYRTGAGSNMTYGNAYGLLNAFTEYVDHYSRNRTADARLWNQFFGAGDKLKQDAFMKVKELL